MQDLPAVATQVFGYDVVEATGHHAAGFLTDAIPAAPPPVDCKVFLGDIPRKLACLRQQSQHETQRSCREGARQRVTTALRDLTPPRATSPDVWRTLAMAAQLFAAYPTSDRWLVLYVDFNEGVRTPAPKQLPLQQVKVIVRLARVLDPQIAQRLRVFKETLTGWGAQVAAAPLELPWPTVFQHAADLFAAATPLLAVQEPPPPVETTCRQAQRPDTAGQAADMRQFMAQLAPGPYWVVVASHETEDAVRKEVATLHSRYPGLCLAYGQAANGKWAVRLGEQYTFESAQLLKGKALALRLRGDTYIPGAGR
jgi:hypothetical protein